MSWDRATASQAPALQVVFVADRHTRAWFPPGSPAPTCFILAIFAWR